MTQILGHVSFTDSLGRKNKETPVTGVKGIVEIVMLLPGKRAAAVRRQASEILVRYMGGDLALVDQVIRNRERQARLARDAPDHPARAFGDAVEAVAGDNSQSTDLATIRRPSSQR